MSHENPSHIKASQANGVLTLQLNRPEKKNALTEAMYKQLTEHFQHASQSSDIKAVVIGGTQNCFTAGNDLSDFIEHPPTDETASVFQFLNTVAEFPKPLIAAVNGHTVGIGTTLLLHCDLVISGQNAQYQLPFVNLALVPEFGASYLLERRVGYAKAAEWLLLGQPFSADAAYHAGLVNTVVADDLTLKTAIDAAINIAQQPEQSVQITKQLMKKEDADKVKRIIAEEGAIFRQRLNSTVFKALVAKRFRG